MEDRWILTERRQEKEIGRRVNDINKEREHNATETRSMRGCHHSNDPFSRKTRRPKCRKIHLARIHRA